MQILLHLISRIPPVENPSIQIKTDFDFNKLRSIYERAIFDAKEADSACSEKKTWGNEYGKWFRNHLHLYYAHTEEYTFNDLMDSLQEKEAHLQYLFETCACFTQIANQSLVEATHQNRLTNYF